MRSHFFFMVLFAALSSLVIALVSKHEPREQWLYFWKFFGSLILIGLLLAWIMYPFPIR
jgi:multisubunit Na+/H+ antiporter MnhB subunit